MNVRQKMANVENTVHVLIPLVLSSVTVIPASVETGHTAQVTGFVCINPQC